MGRLRQRWRSGPCGDAFRVGFVVLRSATQCGCPAQFRGQVSGDSGGLSGWTESALLRGLQRGREAGRGERGDCSDDSPQCWSRAAVWFPGSDRRVGCVVQFSAGPGGAGGGLEWRWIAGHTLSSDLFVCFRDRRAGRDVVGPRWPCDMVRRGMEHGPLDIRSASGCPDRP